MIARLSVEQRAALMELMVCLARSDGYVDDVEADILAQYAHLTGITSCELNGSQSLEDLVAPFDTPASRIAVLQELMRLSHYNRYFSDEEQSAVVEVAALMGLPMDLLAKVETWVMEGIEWEQRGEALVREAERLSRR